MAKTKFLEVIKGTPIDLLNLGNTSSKVALVGSRNPVVKINGVENEIYHKGNRPTPAEIGTLSTAEIELGTFTTRQLILPAGAPATGYIPVIFENIGSNAEVYISTAGGGSPLPMNNCSFNGIVRSSGWGDGTSYASGMFTIYQTDERSIHSIHAPSESVNAAVFYVETRAFPITVKAATIVNVRASATNLVYGTSTFAVNGQSGVGNIKTMTLANFASGTGIYKGSSLVQNQDELDSRYLLQSGGTVNGQLVVSQSGNASIVINSTTGNDDQLQFQNNGKLRWLLGKDAVAETGGNVGGDLNLFGYQDDGTFGGSVLKVRRSTRQLEFQTQPLSIAAQSTSQYALTRRDWVETQDALKVSKSGDTMTGSLIAAKIKNSVMVNDKGSISFQDTGGSRFHLHSDGNTFKVAHGNNGELDILSIGSNGTASLTGSLSATDFIQTTAQSNNAAASTRKDYVDNGLTTKASFRTNFASQLGINRSITGATVPSHAGVWAVNNSTWTPVGYGSLYVTTNRVDELTTTGSGSFIHYLFISHNAAKVYSATNVNGTFSGWKLTDEDSVSKSGDIMTGGLTISKGGNGLTLNPASGSSSYILGQVGGVNNWYVGKGDANGDSIQLSSYAYGTSISLQSDRVVSNKPLYVGTNKVYETSNVVGTVSQSAGVPTGAIIERGSFPDGSEYVKYADGTMLQMGSLTITGKAVSSAVGSIFQSAAVDTITFGIPFVGLVRPSVDFMYSSGGSRPWSILTVLGSSSMSYVLQSGTSMTALSGTYYWSAMGRWF